MNKHIEQLQANIEPLRQEIINHKVYTLINEIEDLQIFMQHHIFAVWDFMSLLKSLQNNLTCTQVPWTPKGSAETRYLINEIVVGEECDVDLDGNQIISFIEKIQTNFTVKEALSQTTSSQGINHFVNGTFDVINSNKDYLQAAVFTFGREDLIPSMFISIVNDIYQRIPSSVSIFKYYLERHIEVDGDHHSYLALEMTSSLCGEDVSKWKEVEQAVTASLKQRIQIWNGVYEAIQHKNKVTA